MRVYIMRVRPQSAGRVFAPMWLWVQDRGVSVLHGWVVDRTLATKMDEADACAWLLRLRDIEDLGGRYVSADEFSSVPV